MERKEYVLRVRVTNGQRDHIKGLAKQQNRTVSDLLRDRLGDLLAGAGGNGNRSELKGSKP